ncbi:prepilin-type N-terminal cleavage/methylation domain-containing protein [Serratia sp. L9]|uniref:prepilin-type N-terminal cleavage/methylation domain-containing protein n=1 Tax=Serratia sp. L9 TaxID=3423946 RepID=UPI003D6769D7
MRDKKQRGMTLLEVLVALVVFAVGCMAVIRATGQQIRSLSELEKKPSQVGSRITSWLYSP